MPAVPAGPSPNRRAGALVGALAATLLSAGLFAAPSRAAAQSRFGEPGAEATGWVHDDADLLSPEREAALERRLAEHERATGNQVVVETMLSLEGRPLEKVALEAATRLGIGQRGRDNGVLLLVALHDRALRIEVGYGLEERLTDARCGRILREEVAPRFRDGDHAGGLEAGVEAILGTLDGTLPGSPLDRVPLVGEGVERVRARLDALPPLPAGDQVFFGLFLFLFGPLVGLLLFAWVRIARFQAVLGLGLFAAVALPLLFRYPFLLGGLGVLALFVLWARFAPKSSASGGGSGSGPGGSRSWSSSSSSSSSGSSSRSSSSSYSGGGGSFGGGGASSRW
jgi:uncharacterized protein